MTQERLATDTAPTQLSRGIRGNGGLIAKEIEPFTTREDPHTKFVITKYKILQSEADKQKWWEEEGHEKDWKTLDFYAQVISTIAFKNNPVSAPIPPTIIWMDGQKDSGAFDELIDDFYYKTDSRNKTALEEKLQNAYNFWQKNFVSKPLIIS